MKKKFRVNFIYAMEQSQDAYVEDFFTLPEARSAEITVSMYTLKLHKAGVMSDYSNMSYIEEFIDGEWEEITGEED